MFLKNPAVKLKNIHATTVEIYPSDPDVVYINIYKDTIIIITIIIIKIIIISLLLLYNNDNNNNNNNNNNK